MVYETFRPAKVQSAVRDGFASLWDSDSGVSADMDKAIAMGYARNQGWFIADGTSNHQAGLAVDMSLAKGDPAQLHEYNLDSSSLDFLFFFPAASATLRASRVSVRRIC